MFQKPHVGLLYISKLNRMRQLCNTWRNCIVWCYTKGVRGQICDSCDDLQSFLVIIADTICLGLKKINFSHSADKVPYRCIGFFCVFISQSQGVALSDKRNACSQYLSFQSCFVDWHQCTHLSRFITRLGCSCRHYVALQLPSVVSCPCLSNRHFGKV